MKQSERSAPIFAPQRLMRRRAFAAAPAARLLCGLLALFAFAALIKPLLSAPAAEKTLPLSAADGRIAAVFAGLAVFAAFAAAFIAARRQKRRALRQAAALPRFAAAAAEGEGAADAAAGKALLLDAAALPLWLRAAQSGEILFANAACAALLKAHDSGGEAAKPASADIETLFPAAHRRAWQQARQNKQNFTARAKLVLNGDRHIFLCRSVYNAAHNCFAESAEDITEQAALRENAARVKQGYAEVFDRLSTSVAIFDPAQRLEFFNSAFAALWPLENAFLESAPSHALLLDRLREKGILNERPDWRAWKEEIFAAYHSPEPQHYIWNLPDGRTLRVVASPHPQGGVTWLFDDLTEKLALQARYETLLKIQGETLDSLSEGVAVFGGSGRLRLSNPAFAALWQLPADLVIEETHIEALKSFCQAANAAPAAAEAAARGQAAEAKTESAAAVWDKIALYITGFADKRDITKGRAELAQGRIYDYMLVPLPQGQTMLSFVNVTDSVNIARALHERNAALESADRLRNDFIRHVSYELRTPLTNIIGFTDLLNAHICGALNEKQSDYLGDIAAQSQILLNLVNNILDLATADAGSLELNITSVAVKDSMAAAAERLSAAFKAKNLTLETEIAAAAALFEADKTRLEQIFVHLLKNAAQAAPQNSAIRFKAEKYGHYLAFSVEDEGPGIPPERRADIFKRFTAYAPAGQKTGAGLGLALVKSLVELHQGHIALETGAAGGTKFICRFPCRERPGAAAQALP